MKVLWFVNNPCLPSRDGRTSVSGGWVLSLTEALKKYPEVTLEVAFLSPEMTDEDEFVCEGMKYYSIQPYKSSSYLVFRVKRLLMSQAQEASLICARMNEIVAASSPDIIHIHGTEKPFGLMAAKFSGQIPVVFSIQGLMNVCAERFFSGIPAADIARHESLSAKIFKKSVFRDRKRAVRQAEDETGFLNKASYIIGRTGWDRRITGLFNPDRKYFHVDELMRRPFYSALWSKNSFSEPFRIVSTLSYGPYKGFETLLKAADLLKRNAGFSFEWQVIGYTGNEEYVRISEKVLGIRASEAGVVFLGRKTAEEMTGIMCGADVFCHVSHVDNSPNSVCEAMMLGMPVIASAVGGVPDLLANGAEGVLVQEGDAHGLAGAVIEIHDGFDRASAFGHAARLKALERHSHDKVCNELITAYKYMMSCAAQPCGK